MDEPPVADEKPQNHCKEAYKPKSILELVEHFPGKTLCCTKVPLRGASDLQEEKNKPE